MREDRGDQEAIDVTSGRDAEVVRSVEGFGREPDGFGKRVTDVAIPVETAPGEIAQVDFVYAGKRYDPERGILRKTWLFVMSLGPRRAPKSGQ